MAQNHTGRKKIVAAATTKAANNFKELETDLKQAATDGRLSSQDRQQITEQLALKPVLQKHQPNWLTSKREKSIKELLKSFTKQLKQIAKAVWNFQTAFY